MNSYLSNAINLLAHVRSILVALGEAEQIPSDDHLLFLERFDELLTALPQQTEATMSDGQEIVVQLFHRYPQIAHLVPRDLLWFFGGDCLHYMPDEEISLYQALDERRFAAEENDEPFDWAAERAQWLRPEGIVLH